ncbi:MAG TPA: putative basic amino acid antiporter YfcC [Synergistaceae bacterium]|nr:putative basic amino acid antiporter YfcC [Synergistaceae bacterium]
MSAANNDTVKKFKVPHTYVILFIIIVLATIGTYFIPAGVYERVKDAATGRTIVDVASYHNVEQTPVSFFGMFKAIPQGMIRAASIVFFVFIMGGSFTMMQATGAIDAGIARVITRFKDRDKLVIPVIMFLFSILGFTIGAAEEVIPFVPIAIALSRGFGYDDIVGVAMVSTGAAVGFSGGMLNPFTVGVAQGIAELPLYSGLAFRSVVYVILYVVAVWYVLRYAAKVKADPTQSVLYGVERDAIATSAHDEMPVMTGRHKMALLAMVVGIGFMIYGVMEQGWYINEISALFILLGIVVAAIGGLDANDMAKSFVQGCRAIAFGALVVGIARVILVVLEQGQIMDAIIHGLASAVGMLPTQITAVGMFVVQSIINFFIPSGSGQAATVMPIMSPLADVLGITRQTAVLAFQYGDAFSNQIIPTSGALLGILGLANVPYDRWLKYNWKLVGLWSIVGGIAVIVASMVELGPF